MASCGDCHLCHRLVAVSVLLPHRKVTGFRGSCHWEDLGAEAESSSCCVLVWVSEDRVGPLLSCCDDSVLFNMLEGA